MNKTQLAYAMVKAANEEAANALANMATPVEGGALGALAGGTLGLGVQGLRRLLGSHDEDDKPSLLRGALLGALGGGAAGYGLAGDAFRTQGLDLLTASGADQLQRAILGKAVEYGRPTFWDAAPVTLNPRFSNQERLSRLLPGVLEGGMSRAGDELMQIFRK